MKKIISLVFILFVVNIFALDELLELNIPKLECWFCEEGSENILHGKAIDEKNKPIAYRLFIIINSESEYMASELKGMTDENGDFEIKIPHDKQFFIQVFYKSPGKYHCFRVTVDKKTRKCFPEYVISINKEIESKNGYVIKTDSLGNHVFDFEKRKSKMVTKRETGSIKSISTEEIENSPIEDNEELINQKAGKPIIFLYPLEKTEVEVKVKLDGKLTHTYPKYNDSWQVTAYPDGKIIDKNDKEYYSLYWEGILNLDSEIEDGFVVKGSETISFLEESLAKLGLNRREANEFIIYWLPHLENNPYNLIHFATTDYIAKAELEIEPKPETSIRLLMRYKPLNEKIKIKEQKLPAKPIERIGFTIVEWGGSLIGSGVVK